MAGDGELRQTRGMTGWVGRTAPEIAAAEQVGDVTAREVAAEHLDRIAAIDEELGAFVDP